MFGFSKKEKRQKKLLKRQKKLFKTVSVLIQASSVMVDSRCYDDTNHQHLFKIVSMYYFGIFDWAAQALGYTTTETIARYIIFWMERGMSAADASRNAGILIKLSNIPEWRKIMDAGAADSYNFIANGTPPLTLFDLTNDDIHTQKDNQ